MLSKKLISAFEKYNGTLLTKFALEEGIDKETLRKAALRGDIEHPSRSVYVLNDAYPDDYFILSNIYSKGIISHESAALLWEYSTFAPFELVMTFPRGYHTESLGAEKIKAISVSKDFHQFGVTETTTWLGNFVKVYDRERTVLDMLASSHSTAANIEEVWNSYLADDQKDLEKLWHYAKIMDREKYLDGLQTVRNLTEKVISED